MGANRWTLDDVVAHQTKVKQGRGPDKPTTKRQKYRNKVVVDDAGRRHASRLEMRRYKELGFLLRVGKIAFLARQVRFILPGGIEYVADFMYGSVRRDDVFPEMVTLERVVVEDTKSPITARLQTYRMKKKLMLAEYGIEISEVGPKLENR